ncbi:MAG: hypothetical protein WEG40_11785 [Candidatus Rokuibacteriota bacterium]
MATTGIRRQAPRTSASGPGAVAAAATDEGLFARRFRDHEGPYHLYDAGARPLIRMETGAHVLGALLDRRARLVFLDDPGGAEGSVLKITYPIGDWSSQPVEITACACGDDRCRGRLVIVLHESHAGPEWTLTFRG